MSRFRTSKGMQRRFRPQVETLEAKYTPSVTLSGTKLIIDGSDGVNNVVVTQNDQADTITVVENNGSAQTFKSSKVTDIKVDLKDGGDSFTFRLAGTWNFVRPKNFVVDLGAGQDSASFDLAHNATSGLAEVNGNISINLLGKGGADKLTAQFGQAENATVTLISDFGTGDDSASVTFLGDFQAANVALRFIADNSDSVDDGSDVFKVDAQGVDLNAASSLDIDMAGGRGTDTLDVLYSGELDGLLKVRMDGGKQRDTVRAGIGLDSHSSGSLDAIIRGGAELVDTVALSLLNESTNVAVINAKQFQD